MDIEPGVYSSKDGKGNIRVFGVAVHKTTGGMMVVYSEAFGEVEKGAIRTRARLELMSVPELQTHYELKLFINAGRAC